MTSQQQLPASVLQLVHWLSFVHIELPLPLEFGKLPLLPPLLLLTPLSPDPLPPEEAPELLATPPLLFWLGSDADASSLGPNPTSPP